MIVWLWWRHRLPAVGTCPENGETAGAGKPTPAEDPRRPLATRAMDPVDPTRRGPGRSVRAPGGDDPAFTSVVPHRLAVPQRSGTRSALEAYRTGTRRSPVEHTPPKEPAMNSLWTPDGEHPIDQPEDTPAPSVEPLAQDLEPEEREQVEAMAREMAAVREQLASVPAAVVVANHLMGLYELATIHLSQQPPNLGEASVAIDALGAVVDRLPGRLGEAETTMRDALHQIRLAYVAVDRASREDDTPPEPEAG